MCPDMGWNYTATGVVCCRYSYIGGYIVKRVENFLASFPFAEQTKDRYRRVLGQLIALDLESLDAAALLRFIDRPEWGSSMRYVALSCCRKFIGWLYGAGHSALNARVKRIPTAPQPRLSKDQVLTLLRSFDLGSVAGLRDYAMVCTALDCNLRVTELCNVQIGNVRLDTCNLFALVKGGQWVWKTFSPKTASALSAWMDARSPALGVGTLFVSFQLGNYGHPLTREGVQGIMKRWGKKVGFHISPHMFRRSYASLSTINGAPKNIVKVGGGWKTDEIVDHYIGDLAVELTRPYLPMQNLF